MEQTKREEFKIVRTDKAIKRGDFIAVVYSYEEARLFVKAMNEINGKKYEYYIW